MTRITTFNVRSIKNKDHLIVNELNDNNVNIAVITETWLKDTKEDQAQLDKSEFKQGNIHTHSTKQTRQQERRWDSDHLQEAL